MRSVILLFAVLAAVVRVARAQAVFAHVIVGNNAAYQVTDWQADIHLAASKGIDAFALNIAPPLAGNTATQVALAFQAAAKSRFKLFLSFDYLGGGIPWASNDIITLLQQYASNVNYYKYLGLPFVSTFEGPTNSDVSQWSAIRTAIPGGIYFVPDWSSQGPGYRMDLIDGAFSWDMWPNGPVNMTIQPDQKWLTTLAPAKKTYMMGVSPWFFTDMPAYRKAWVWRGDSMWYDRWLQVSSIKPPFVQIVSWNDFGESHYIGPIQNDSTVPHAPGADATPWVTGFPHSAWLETLPYQIAAYKHAFRPKKYPAPVVASGQDKIVYWYRTSPVLASGSTDVTGNYCPSSINSGGYQQCYPVSQILEDGIFAIVLASQTGKSATIQVGSSPPQTFRRLKAGINFISRGFNGQTGQVTVRLSSGEVGEGAAIANVAADQAANFNAWVGCAGTCT